MLNFICCFTAQSLSKIGIPQLLVLALSLSAFAKNLYILGFNFSDVSDYYFHSFTRTDLALTLWEEYVIHKGYHRLIYLKEDNM